MISQKIFAVKHKDLRIRMESRSGGIFTALSDQIIKNNGIVYGCVMEGVYTAKHIRADNQRLRDCMRGSKYIQSDTRNIFNAVKKDLEAYKEVMFSGTPCQNAGLKSFLNKEYQNLLLIDIVCHGVPSPDVWKKYIEWQEKKVNGKCVDVNFRNKKKFGWGQHYESLLISTESDYQMVDSNIFAKLYYSNYIVRPCCFTCPYKSLERMGDITIGDYWGIEKAAPSFGDRYGISLVLLNTEKGVKYFDRIKNEIFYEQCCIEDSMQEPLIKPYPEKHGRKKFWTIYRDCSFEQIVKKYARSTISERIALFKRMIKR